MTQTCSHCGGVIIMLPGKASVLDRCPSCGKSLGGDRESKEESVEQSIPEISIPRREEHESIFGSALESSDALFDQDVPPDHVGANEADQLPAEVTDQRDPGVDSTPSLHRKSDAESDAAPAKGGEAPGQKPPSSDLLLAEKDSAIARAARSNGSPSQAHCGPEPETGSAVERKGVTATQTAEVSSAAVGLPQAENELPTTVEALTFITAGDSTGKADRLPGAEGSGLPARRSKMRRSVFVVLVVVPLISYAILATLAILVLLLRSPPPDPLERLPDLEGQYKGAKHTRQGSVSFERVRPDAPLPAKLRVGLGERIRVGDVELYPRRVELRRIVILQSGFEPEPGSDDSLVLKFTVKNMSEDTRFSPTDPYFDRQWNSPSSSGAPYTCLEVGDHRLYGGPLKLTRSRPTQMQEAVEGQPYRILNPGEELVTQVCTDPDAHVGKIISSYHGPLVWRLWLRRGFVQVGDREVSATAVIGVDFRDRDIHVPASSGVEFSHKRSWVRVMESQRRSTENLSETGLPFIEKSRPSTLPPLLFML